MCQYVTTSVVKNLMFKSCHNEPVEVLIVDGQIDTFFRSIKLMVVFHVNMLSQLHFQDMLA